ncbi:helix-turn-helix domain-containing protein [Streptomyces sp. NPDC056660]|uniref:helix-turn-helix domain-containing protein n=1 Tax=Streptomyces sp. NPDC056660 TaxID=3345897 RepID=UPI00368193CE
MGRGTGDGGRGTAGCGQSRSTCVDRPPPDTRCPGPPDSPDRRRAQAAEDDGLRPEDRAPAEHARADCPARGTGALQCAHRLCDGLHLDTVRRLRGRFAEHGLGGLSDRKRSGRPPKPVLRYRAGDVRNWPARWPPGPSPDRSRPPSCDAGSPTTPSSPGSTSCGSSSATRALAPRPTASWTCTPAPGTASRWARAGT